MPASNWGPVICTAPKTSTGTAIAIRKALEFLFAFGFCKCFIYSVFVTHIISNTHRVKFVMLYTGNWTRVRIQDQDEQQPEHEQTRYSTPDQIRTRPGYGTRYNAVHRCTDQDTDTATDVWTVTGLCTDNRTRRTNVKGKTSGQNQIAQQIQ